MSPMSVSRAARSAVPPLAEFQALEPRWLFSTFDISGVQSASIDQPQVHAIFRTTPGGNPLGGTSPTDGIAVEAYLDTGASGVLLSQEKGDALGLTHDTFNGQNIGFTDVGVAGSDAFDVSTAIYGSIAPVRSIADDDIPVEDFNQNFGPVRVQINRNPADEELDDELNVIGMPALQGKVAVMDPTPLNATDINDVDGMRTFVYAPGTPYDDADRATDPGIPEVNRHVKLSYGDFSKYTTTTPSGAQGPTLASNPFIGPNPVRAAGVVDTTPKIHMTNGGLSADGSFLLDTGAAASFISQNIAAKLGVHYKAGTYGTDDPILLDASGTPLADQFTLPIGGIGGTITAAGFKMSSLALPTTEGEPIRFLDAPVMVLDVTVEDPTTHVQTTLDGDFGMNFLVASIDVDGTSLGDESAGAFDWLTFDQPNGVLGLDIPGAGPVSPPPVSPPPVSPPPVSPPPVSPPPPPTATIGGFVYNDLNADGARQAGEPGVGGRTIYIDRDNSGTLTKGDTSTTTADDGSYSFAGLAVGSTFRVRQVLPSGWKAKQPTGVFYTVSTPSAAKISGKNFGDYQNATFKGSVFSDANASGARDTGEGALSGWTVYLDLNNSGTKDSGDLVTTTDASGNYTFSGLAPKTYTAHVVAKTGYRLTTPAAKKITATLTSGQLLSGQAFGATQRASVSGVVFSDINKNGVKDAADAGLSAWKVYIDANNDKKWEASERFVMTSATGAWTFPDLAAGKKYAIRVVAKTGFTATGPAGGAFTLTPASGALVTSKNFGEHKA